MSSNDQFTPSARVTILLIQEQLKSNKLFSTLSQLGIETAFYQANLTELIAGAVGLGVDSKIDYGFCYRLLMQHSKRVVEDADELYDEATRVYRLLVAPAAVRDVEKTMTKQTD